MYLFGSYFLDKDLIYTTIFQEEQLNFTIITNQSPIRALEKEYHPIGGN